MPLRTAADALLIVEEQVNLVRADMTAGPQLKGRTVAYRLTVGLRAIEVSELAARLAKLEKGLGSVTPNP